MGTDNFGKKLYCAVVSREMVGEQGKARVEGEYF